MAIVSEKTSKKRKHSALDRGDQDPPGANEHEDQDKVEETLTEKEKEKEIEKEEKRSDFWNRQDVVEYLFIRYPTVGKI